MCLGVQECQLTGKKSQLQIFEAKYIIKGKIILEDFLKAIVLVHTKHYGISYKNLTCQMSAVLLAFCIGTFKVLTVSLSFMISCIYK